MSSLFEITAAVRKQSREEFLKQYPSPVLLVQTDQLNRERSFKTNTISGATADLARAMATGTVKLNPDVSKYEVMPVVKSKNSPWAGRISIGRARNNDIVIEDASVSKMHAHVIDEGPAFKIADASSHNGTVVNGQKLEGTNAVTLKSKDAVVFGAIVTKLLSAADLYEFVVKEIILVDPKT